MDYYKILAVLSPFISAFLAGLLAYYFTLKTKKFDILYQNKLPAFKEMAAKLIDFKKFCNGRIAFLIGSEYSPYYEENVGTLEHRTTIANIFDANSIFLCAKSRKKIEDLIAHMSGLSNAEAAITGGDEMQGIEKEYERLLLLTEDSIETLYKELNLK